MIDPLSRVVTFRASIGEIRGECAAYANELAVLRGESDEFADLAELDDCLADADKRLAHLVAAIELRRERRARQQAAPDADEPSP